MTHRAYLDFVPKPSIPHRIITEEEIKTWSRLIVIGDVHGCLDELKALLQQCEYDVTKGDQVLLLGDLVNKGPYSAEVVRFVRESKMLCLRGNHDDHALYRALSSSSSLSSSSWFSKKSAYIHLLSRYV
jgi:predicted phosphodiesterase